MRYYKSDNQQVRVNEAIQYLRREIARQYSRSGSGNKEFIANKRKITRTWVDQLKLSVNVPGMVFYPSRRYRLSQLARRNEELVNKNQDIISGDARVQLAEEIATTPGMDPQVAVFAIEQLLQDPSEIVAHEPENINFRENSYRTGIGIGRLSKRDAQKSEGLRKERASIIETYQSNLDKRRYSFEILQKVISEFGEYENSQESLRELDNSFVQEMGNANIKMIELKGRVADMLEANHITSGFDTGWETLMKMLKKGARALFKRIFRGNRAETQQNYLLTRGEKGTEKPATRPDAQESSFEQKRGEFIKEDVGTVDTPMPLSENVGEVDGQQVDTKIHSSDSNISIL